MVSQNKNTLNAAASTKQASF